MASTQTADQIRTWIASGAPFRAGVHLLEVISPASPSLRTYRSALQSSLIHPDTYTSLKRELSNILMSAPASAKTVSAQASAKTQIEAKPSIYAASEDDTPTIAALKRNAQKLHKQHDAIRIALREADTDERRFELAHDLLSNVMPALDDIYYQIRAFAKTGVEPPHPDLEPLAEKMKLEIFEMVQLDRQARNKTITAERRARLNELRDQYGSLASLYKQTP